MNIPDIVGASITSIAFIGGGIGLYTTGEARDAVTDQRVADLLVVAEKSTESVARLSEDVLTLKIKQTYNEQYQREVVYNLKELSTEVKGMGKNLIDILSKGTK